jgi:CheY-like chemotaxis protein
MTLSTLPMEPLKTLLVDDEEPFGENMVGLLDDRGFDADFVPSAEDAIERSASCDVVVVDLSLPGMSGRDLAETIQREHPAKWIVLLTAKKVLRRELEKAGTIRYEGFFDKPLIGNELKRFLEKLKALERQKRQTTHLINGVLEDLRTAADTRQSRLDRQAALVSVKTRVREDVQAQFRHRSPERRQIALMLRVALDGLSLVPSEAFRLSEPTPEQFEALREGFLILGSDERPPTAERDVDRLLDRVGLGVGLQVPDPSVFFDR